MARPVMRPLVQLTDCILTLISLLPIAIIQALKHLANTARSQDDGMGILLCIAECILACIANLIEYFNKWAFM